MKTPSYSETIMTEIVFPNDTNPMGILQGGRLMHWMDIASAVCAQTHSEKIAVTVSVDQVHFKYPAKLGDILTIRAKITRAFYSSMEIFVEVYTRKVKSPETFLSNKPFYTFVAIDENECPAPIPQIAPETEKEKQMYEEAMTRRKLRKNEK
jgi:acyl-CoA hydrolase